MNANHNDEETKETEDIELPRNLRDKLLLYYAAIIAFTLGIVGNILANIIPTSPPIVPFSVIFCLILVSYHLLKQISKDLKVDNPKETSEGEKCPIHLDCLRMAREFFKEEYKEKENFPYLGFQTTSPRKKLFFLSGRMHIIPLIITFALMSLLEEKERTIPGYLWFIYCLWISNISDEDHLNLRDKVRIYLASKWNVKIYFLIKGGRYLSPKEYYLVIDSKEEKFFFAYYIRKEKLENYYSEKIQRLMNKIEEEDMAKNMNNKKKMCNQK